MMKILNSLVIALLLIFVSILFLGCQEKYDKELAGQLIDNFKMASSQYKILASSLDSTGFPKSFENGQLKTSGSGWWCSGFYPGSLLLIYEQTGDSVILKEAQKRLAVLEREKHNRTTHDLGFMMYCSFGQAYRVLGDESYVNVIKTSSESLITRYNSSIGCIRSWDPAPWNDKWQYPVIIDNMMNLEMLLWTSMYFNAPKYADIARTHADTTMKNHFRSDYSSYHVVSYDPISGNVEMKNTDQGFADESSWARGQGWGLYGYTTMYRFTKDKKYLELAQGIANYLINHPHFPNDGIPYWDFNAPDIPEAKRDASAGAIMASALLELQKYVNDEKAEEYLKVAETILSTLSTNEYTADVGTNGGFLLKHSVGNMPDRTEVDVALSYADYYYLEAMSRYIELIN